ncbi:NADH dehydrogenase subunit 6 [Planoprotostelium fungivorum]|uniref:NADH dehydrogenase subunit 6 (Mitochondrion) n=1 Tax=Planoprotostelium fungivorum TaxID=1890364 RepID=A0A2P6NQK9_9EUKA|nr:NADH dehydrogenase subunit 6 [Planoprotostelium fungivorum]
MDSNYHYPLEPTERIKIPFLWAPFIFNVVLLLSLPLILINGVALWAAYLVGFLFVGGLLCFFYTQGIRRGCLFLQRVPMWYQVFGFLSCLITCAGLVSFSILLWIVRYSGCGDQASQQTERCRKLNERWLLPYIITSVVLATIYLLLHVYTNRKARTYIQKRGFVSLTYYQ